MKLFSALRKYFALTSAQRQFISKGIWACNQPPSTIISFLRPLAAFDSDLDKGRDQLMKIGCGGLILSFVVAIMIGNEVIPESSAGIAMFLVLTLGLGSFIARWLLGSMDMHNNLRLFVVPLLNALQQDMAPGKNMIFKLDLRGKTCKSKMISQKHDNPGWFRYPKLSTYNFKDYWFSCVAPLVDGSTLKITVDDKVRQRKKTYSSRSGKTKYKTKIKIKSKISASLAMKTKTYDLEKAGSLNNLCDRLKVKDKDRRKAVGMTVYLISASEASVMEPSVCLGLVGKILMNAAPAKAKGA